MTEDVMSMENFRDIEHKRLMQVAMFGYRYGHSNPKPYTMPPGGGKTLVVEEMCRELGLKSTVWKPRNVGTSSYTRQSLAAAAAVAQLEHAFTDAAKKLSDAIQASFSMERFQGEMTLILEGNSAELKGRMLEDMGRVLREAGFCVTQHNAEEFLPKYQEHIGKHLQASFNVLQTKVQFPKEAFLKTHPKAKKGMPYYHGKRRY